MSNPQILVFLSLPNCYPTSQSIAAIVMSVISAKKKKKVFIVKKFLYREIIYIVFSMRKN